MNDDLKLMRRFYTLYSNAQIRETVFPQFEETGGKDI